METRSWNSFSYFYTILELSSILHLALQSVIYPQWCEPYYLSLYSLIPWFYFNHTSTPHMHHRGLALEFYTFLQNHHIYSVQVICRHMTSLFLNSNIGSIRSSNRVPIFYIFLPFRLFFLYIHLYSLEEFNFGITILISYSTFQLYSLRIFPQYNSILILLCLWLMLELIKTVIEYLQWILFCFQNGQQHTLLNLKAEEEISV